MTLLSQLKLLSFEPTDNFIDNLNGKWDEGEEFVDALNGTGMKVSPLMIKSEIIFTMRAKFLMVKTVFGMKVKILLTRKWYMIKVKNL